MLVTTWYTHMHAYTHIHMITSLSFKRFNRLIKFTEALDTGENVVGKFLDFPRAFDTVDYDNSWKNGQLWNIWCWIAMV